jgi:hypothetical protein
MKKKKNLTKVKYLNRDGSVHYGFLLSKLLLNPRIKIERKDGIPLRYVLEYYDKEKGDLIAFLKQI